MGNVINIGGTMAVSKTLRQFAAIACMAGFTFAAGAAFAQSGNGKPPETPQKTPAEVAKESQRKVDEISEAATALPGTAGQAECVWLGRRVVGLLWRDDLDTAFRHLDLYDRFACPSAHVQATFRCLIRQGNFDPKAQETLNGRVHACWLNPALVPAPPTEAQPAAAPAAPAAPAAGTPARQ